MHEAIRLVAVMSTIILLPSCGPRKIKKAASQKAAFSMPLIQTTIDTEQSIVELEAKITDIPTLIGSRILSIHQISEQPQQVRLELECDQNLAEVDAYYAEQMLYNGWQQVTAINDAYEIMHVYKKPSKLCIVILRNIHLQCVVTITTSDINSNVL